VTLDADNRPGSAPLRPQGRILGLDVGDVRIGVAVSDPFRIIAQAHTVVVCSSEQRAVEAIAAIAAELDAVLIVAGVPLNREGKPGPQAEKVLAFVARLRAALDIEVVTLDERYTTASAERKLIAANVRRKKRKAVIDKVAAQEILQTYLDSQKRPAPHP